MIKIISSQLKVIPGKELPIDEYAITSAMIFKNEPFSFQIVYTMDKSFQPVTIDIDSPIVAQTWRIDSLPVSNASNDYNEPGYVTDCPSIVPDLLEPRPLRPKIDKVTGAFVDALYFENNTEHTLNASKAMQSVLVTLNPDSRELKAGRYSIKVVMRELTNYTDADCACLEIEVIDATLPKQDFCVTNWFHVDCICDYYGCEPYSERFYEIFETFIKNMTGYRQNTLLLPSFTPSLDTPIGKERRNVQLVDVWRENDKWHFDFAHLAKFMKKASECGIEFFEHCHLFTQWGAKNTPNIYSRCGKKIFGWETDASGKEYTEFIRSYLKAFIDFARTEGYSDEQLIFHISDEPTKEMLEGYKKAFDTVADLLLPFKCIDALAEIDYYKKGLVKIPVASIEHADIFANECDSFWLYYTCGTYVKMCTNRLLTNTPARTRILGTQMYKYKANGFLHWGYNYYYDCMSNGLFDPKVNPCGYKMLPGGAYLAYPELNGAVPSLREVHMRESFDDLRALKLYEALSSRNEADNFIEKEFGKVDAHFIPEGNAVYAFSQALKQAIKEKI